MGLPLIGKMEMKFSFLMFLFMVPLAFAQLKVGFYQSTCPRAELIVRQVVQKRFNADRSVTAALLRMHFHDCFVHGCDASILIDSTQQQQSEKDAGANQTVREFELIDEIKTALEAACPGKVSCADIITLATRDAVALAGGPSYTIPTGRRDGLVSNVNDVDLPGPTVSVTAAFQIFQSKGLTLNDMVTILGAHTVGVAHCFFFSDRLSDFQGTGKPDPSMDPALVTKLTKTCAATNTNPTAFLDQNTSFVVDNEYFKQLLLKRGILQIDQELATDKSTSPIVSSFARNGAVFMQSFANAMVKMGSIDVLLGNAGEIRSNCRVFNAKNKAPAPPPKKAPAPPQPPKKAPAPPPKKAPAPPPTPNKTPAPPPPPPPPKGASNTPKKAPPAPPIPKQASNTPQKDSVSIPKKKAQKPKKKGPKKAKTSLKKIKPRAL